ncbi:accessory gene regulator B family protein [Paenibacillus sp. NAIST15-1]|uniref:accessory gene regulator B family protein n=1 Tax=Paenibacillus sp. NAIST15-1 TaxID=1605994 RepID=UPI00086EEFF3|nr:accessory gene regulator B family protein [Paenibacillus sp. NAIST15-1]GAV11378.1 putative membrane protein [Paenibacillus sp. NAIST15-1]
MISKLSKKLAKYLFSNIDENDMTRFANKGYDIVELESRLKVLFIYMFMIPIIIIESAFTGLWMENLISLVIVFGLRVLNKGHHFSPDVCLIVTTSIIVSVPLISEFLNNDLLKLNIVIITIILYILFPEQLSTKNYHKKFISIILCVFGYYLIDLLLAALFILSFDQLKLKRG